MIELLLVAERLLDEGMTDRAEHLFAQVAEADPRNAIAVVGLARVALARGDADGAVRLATRALEIDPDDAAAQRLVDELGPGTQAAPEPEPTPTAVRRSWLDRLLGFVRRR